MGEGQELTYDEIVEHIVSDKPVPNLVQVPNIILEESLRSVSEMAPRPKPWETSGSDDGYCGTDGLNIDLGRSDLPLESSVTDLDMVSKYQTMEAEFDSVITDQESSDA